MSLDPAQTVTLVGIHLLLEQNASIRQRLGQCHALLKVNIVVGRTVYQQKLLVPQLVHIFGQITFLVTLVIIRYIRKT